MYTKWENSPQTTVFLAYHILTPLPQMQHSFECKHLFMITLIPPYDIPFHTMPLQRIELRQAKE